MLDTLRMVRGAVAEKDLIPVLTHFFIYDGRIQGANSRISIDAPLSELQGVSITVPADLFIKAVNLCAEEPTLTVFDTHILMKQGRYTIKLPTIGNDAFPRSVPNEADWEPEAPLLEVLRTLRAFVSTDARNVWSMGIWVDEEYAYATNNVIVLRIRCDFLTGTGCKVNLPSATVDEILRIGQEPKTFGVSGNSLTLHYADTSWIKSQLIDAPWPVATLERLFSDKDFKRIPLVSSDFTDAVSKITPFCDNSRFPVIAFKDGSIQTEGATHGAAAEGFALPDARYNANMLALVLEHATHFQPDKAFNLFRVGNGEGILAALIA